MGQSIFDFLDVESHASVQGVLEKALGGESTANYNLTVTTKGGGPLVLFMNATTRRNADGEIIGVIGIAQHITVQEELRVETSRSDEELRLLIATANAVIFGVDKAVCITDWNVKQALLVPLFFVPFKAKIFLCSTNI